MLQFISHYNSRFSYLEGIALALEGGCRWIQLRMKEASDEEFLACAKEAGPLCRSYGARFIIDDRVRLLEACGADISAEMICPSMKRERFSARTRLSAARRTP